jgi:hypothetical protein
MTSIKKISYQKWDCNLNGVKKRVLMGMDMDMDMDMDMGTDMDIMMMMRKRRTVESLHEKLGRRLLSPCNED